MKKKLSKINLHKFNISSVCVWYDGTTLKFNQKISDVHPQAHQMRCDIFLYIFVGLHGFVFFLLLLVVIVVISIFPHHIMNLGILFSAESQENSIRKNCKYYFKIIIIVSCIREEIKQQDKWWRGIRKIWKIVTSEILFELYSLAYIINSFMWINLLEWHIYIIFRKNDKINACENDFKDIEMMNVFLLVMMTRHKIFSHIQYFWIIIHKIIRNSSRFTHNHISRLSRIIILSDKIQNFTKEWK